LNDPVKEIHAIRLKIQDEMAGMSLEEKIDSLNQQPRPEGRGIKPFATNQYATVPFEWFVVIKDTMRLS
jgi:hypothetical protein